MLSSKTSTCKKANIIFFRQFITPLHKGGRQIRNLHYIDQTNSSSGFEFISFLSSKRQSPTIFTVMNQIVLLVTQVYNQHLLDWRSVNLTCNCDHLEFNTAARFLKRFQILLELESTTLLLLNARNSAGRFVLKFDNFGRDMSPSNPTNATTTANFNNLTLDSTSFSRFFHWVWRFNFVFVIHCRPK